MSDLRVKMPMKIVDPTTDANAMGVDASGNAQVILAANTGVDIGDVDVLTMPGTAAEAAALPAVLVVVAGDDGVDTHPLQLSATGDLQVELGAAIPTGSNVIGNVGLEAGSNNIGDVDVLTMPATAAEDAALPAVVMVVAGDDGTDTRILQLSAAGDLQVELGTELPAGTQNIGDVDVASMSALVAGSANIGDVDIVGGTLASDVPMTTDPVTIGGRASTATPTAVSADGDVVDLWLSREGAMQVDIVSGGGGPEDTDDDIVAGGQQAVLGISLGYAWDGTQWERLTSDASGSLDVNVTLALPAGDNNIGNFDIVTAPFSDGFGAASGEPAEAILISGTDNTDTYGILVDAQGHLQIDVLSGGGATVPAGPTMEALVAAAVVAGGTGFLDSAEISEAEKIYQVSVASTVPFKFRIGMQENTVRVTTKRTGWMFGQAGTVSYFTPGHPDFYEHAGTSGGTDTIYVEYFNMDNSETADIHATIEYAT